MDEPAGAGDAGKADGAAGSAFDGGEAFDAKAAFDVDGTDEQRAPLPKQSKGRSERASSTSAFDSFASWVPPWARSLPELVVEPAADYSPQELGIGRLAYASPEELPNPDEFEAELGDDKLRGAVEAILFVIDEPVSTVMLAQVLEEPTPRIEEAVRSLAHEYVTTRRGFELREVAGGWRMYTRADFAPYVERFVLDGQQIRLTQAALETLAVIAYKQPVTRSRVSAVRGVNCDGVIKTLVTRGLVEECGLEPESGGHLYQTTRLFLEKLGINSVEDLPSVAPYLPGNVDDIDVPRG